MNLGERLPLLAALAWMLSACSASHKLAANPAQIDGSSNDPSGSVDALTSRDACMVWLSDPYDGAEPFLTPCSTSLPCTSDEDCATLGASDGRCKKGYSCEIPSVVGPLACQQSCTCTDFMGSRRHLIPDVCRVDGGASH